MFVLTMCWRTEQNFLLTAINLIVPVSICRQLASLWVSKFVITLNSFDTKLEEKFERYLRFDREFNWIEVLVFNFPAKFFLLRLLHVCNDQYRMQLLALMQGSVFVTLHMIFERKVIASLQHASTLKHLCF